MLVKVHTAPDGRKVLAICDKDCFGKRYEEGRKQLDLTSRFYQGRELLEDEIRELVKTADIINAAGEKSVSLLKSMGLADEGQIIRVRGVTHAHVVIV